MALATVGALHLVLRQAPAANTALQLRGMDGTMRQGPSIAMHDYGAYLFQTGYDRLYADAFAQDPLTPDAAAAARAEARAFFEEALRHDPSNAHIWQAYAQSLLYREGAEAQVAAALARSATLAPTSPVLAAARLQALRTYRSWTSAPDAMAAQARTDLAVLERHAPRVAARFTSGD